MHIKVQVGARVHTIHVSASTVLDAKSSLLWTASYRRDDGLFLAKHEATIEEAVHSLLSQFPEVFNPYPVPEA